jgi:L-fuculose-phosphate aldolase
MEKADPREIVAEIAREIYNRRLTRVYGGGASMRDGDKIWVTATYYPLQEGSLTCFGETKPEHIIPIDLETGKKISGDWNPSWETPAHIAIYKNNPEVNGVVHCHPPYATAFATANIDLVCWSDSPRSHLGKVPVVQLVPCGSDWLASNIAEGLQERPAILLRNHGIWVKGKNIRLALHEAELVEEEAQQQIFAALLRMPAFAETCEKLSKEAKFLDEIHKEEKRIKDRTFGINYTYPKAD